MHLMFVVKDNVLYVFDLDGRLVSCAELKKSTGILLEAVNVDVIQSNMGILHIYCGYKVISSKIVNR